MADEKFFPATNDVIFKALFVKNQKLLKAFLSAALEIPVSEIKVLTIKNAEMPPVYIDGKLTRLDILLETNGKVINIEMQVAKRDDYKERTLLYWARMYSEEMKQGKAYNETGRCICINILNFGMFDCEDYHSSFSVLEDKRHERLTDRMHLHFFELTKVPSIKRKNQPDTTDDLRLWMQLFKAKDKEELDMLKSTSADAILILNKDKDICDLAKEREEAEMDYYSGLLNAEAKGRAEGEAKGRAEGEAKGRAEGEAKGRAEGEAIAHAKLIAKWKAKGKTDEEIAELLADD